MAFAIDVAVLFAILALPQAALRFTLGFSLFDLSGFSNSWGLEAFVLLTISLPSWLYFILSDASGLGASLGKRAMGLRVVGSDAGRVGLGRAALRTLIKMIPWELTHTALLVPVPLLGTGAAPSTEQAIRLGLVYVLLFGYLIVVVRSGGVRGIHDFAAGTQVVKRDADAG